MYPACAATCTRPTISSSMTSKPSSPGITASFLLGQLRVEDHHSLRIDGDLSTLRLVSVRLDHYLMAARRYVDFEAAVQPSHAFGAERFDADLGDEPGAAEATHDAAHLTRRGKRFELDA